MALMMSARWPFLASNQRRAAAGRAERKIRRPHQSGRALDEHQRLALIPGVIAERDGVGAGVEQFLIDRFRDAESAGRILAIDDDEIEPEVADHAGQMFGDGGAPGPADDVAHEENAQVQLRKSNILVPLAHNQAARRGTTPAPPRFPVGKGKADGRDGFHLAQMRQRKS